MPSLLDVVAPKDAIQFQKGLRHAREFAALTAKFIQGEEMSSADAGFFFAWRTPRPIAAMISVFLELTRTDLLEDPELGVVLVVPLPRSSSLGSNMLPLDELVQQLWTKDEPPKVHVGRRSALDGFENVSELRKPLEWAEAPADVSIFFRCWQSHDSSEVGLFENALYCRYFLSEGEFFSFDFGLPPR